jgi:hypothetical protein
LLSRAEQGLFAYPCHRITRITRITHIRHCVIATFQYAHNSQMSHLLVQFGESTTVQVW